MQRLFVAGLRMPLAARGLAGVALAASGTLAYQHSFPRRLPPKDPSDRRLLLERGVMEAICGAVGEVAQVCVLYPLETIKVRCQAGGVSSVAALRDLIASAGPAGAVRQLYAGVGAAALCAVLVGAVHYASFCMSKRAAAAAAAGEGGGAEGADGGGGGGATAVAAVVGAVSTALVEAPCDLYRHMAQAGVVKGDFLSEMVGAVRRGGPGALYSGTFLAFCMESLPYDFVELGTYGGLGDLRDSLARRGDALGARVAAVPTQAWDVAIGATAGAAAVAVSMPLDCIKTHLQTHGAHAVVSAGGGAWGEAAAFAATGARLVRAQGPGALFTGIAPRLVQQVPSSTLCWVVIERCRELLEPYTKP